MQVHVPYSVYAHVFMMRELLLGAGVKRVEYSIYDKSERSTIPGHALKQIAEAIKHDKS